MSRFLLEFSAKAEEEFHEARKWYDEKREGLGSAFTEEVFDLINLLSKNPYLFGVKFAAYREAPLKRFPYILVYQIEGDTIYIDMVFHTSRDPEKKQDR